MSGSRFPERPAPRPRTASLGPVFWSLVAPIALVQAFLSVRADLADEAAFRFAVIPARFTGAFDGFSHPLAALGPLLGHVFLHAGWLHLLFNMMVLLQVSQPAEGRLGLGRFLAMFFGAGVAGAAAYIALNPASMTPAVGASGAVCGVFGATLLAARPRWTQALLDRRVLTAGFWFLAVNVGLAALARVSGLLPIAWEAHLGGFLGGAALYPFLAPRSRGPWG